MASRNSAGIQDSSCSITKRTTFNPLLLGESSYLLDYFYGTHPLNNKPVWPLMPSQLCLLICLGFRLATTSLAGEVVREGLRLLSCATR
jgi:hypothetical protein